ncbi:MAG: lipase maturation factor family protein [Janthinobacterium lividum]
MLSFTSYFGHLALTRLFLQRGMAAIYLVAFLNVRNQAIPLLGTRGLLPIPDFLESTTFRDAPSLFHWRYSDRLLSLVAWTGLAISTCAVFGLTELGPIWLSVGAWLVLYVLYLSIVNVGQNFFGFGWESMLLEAGFFTAFLGPRHTAPSVIPILILRWMFFRTELGAGLIKLRHDSCWRDLTCLYYHYETQPLPNPLSWYFHRLPKFSHRFGVLFSHFLQVICPFGLFAPQPIASVAAVLCITQQLWLIISGNYSWLNWLTVVLGFAGFSDEICHTVLPFVTIPGNHPAPLAFTALLWVAGAATVALSVQPVLNLFSRQQRMNFSYNRYHLVNTYGAFGSVTRERHEIVLEGTDDRVATPATVWQEYGFKGKPGDLRRMPPQIAPYHLRLDWMIWFLPFTVAVTNRGIHVRSYEIWFLRFVKRLLTNDDAILRLMRLNPFPDQPPAAIRARFYRYRYTDLATKRATGNWWSRELLGEYLDPISLDSLRRL